MSTATFLLAIPVLVSGQRLLRQAEANTGESEPMTPSLTSVGTPTDSDVPPVIVAVGAHGKAATIVDAAARISRETGSPLEVVHVQQTAVVEEQAVDTETADQARAAVTAQLDRLAATGIAATGRILTSLGDHAAAGRVLAEHAAHVGARIIAVGRSPHGPLTQFTDGSLTTALAHAASCTVVLVDADHTPRQLNTATLAELRNSAV